MISSFEHKHHRLAMERVTEKRLFTGHSPQNFWSGGTVEELRKPMDIQRVRIN